MREPTWQLSFPCQSNCGTSFGKRGRKFWDTLGGAIASAQFVGVLLRDVNNVKRENFILDLLLKSDRGFVLFKIGCKLKIWPDLLVIEKLKGESGKSVLKCLKWDADARKGGGADIN
jgi:hypothetical protein